MDKVNYGDIEINANFRRKSLINDKYSSELMESLVIGFNVPSIKLGKLNENEYLVLDGLQRISGFMRCLKKPKNI